MEFLRITMRITNIGIKCGISLRAAVASDFHSRSSDMRIEKSLALIKNASPDLILCPGDIMNSTHERSVLDADNLNGLEFLTKLTETAPVVYSIGNHEHGMNEDNNRVLAERGIILLDNDSAEICGITVGGLTTGYRKNKTEYSSPPVPETSFIDSFAGISGFKLLLCHHPEYFTKYILGKGINLTVSGHAHGGQWEFFSRGVYAPGQGLFPKFTSGMHSFGDEHLAISRGMTNTVPIPRFFNPCEILMLDMTE